jgi:hypothetical protein
MTNFDLQQNRAATNLAILNVALRPRYQVNVGVIAFPAAWATNRLEALEGTLAAVWLVYGLEAVESVNVR